MGIVTHDRMKNLIWAKFAFKAEIGVLQKDVGVAEAWVANN
jgi:hypothetical protein